MVLQMISITTILYTTIKINIQKKPNSEKGFLKIYYKSTWFVVVVALFCLWRLFTFSLKSGRVSGISKQYELSESHFT